MIGKKQYHPPSSTCIYLTSTSSSRFVDRKVTMTDQTLTTKQKKVLAAVRELLDKREDGDPSTYRKIDSKHGINITAVSLAINHDTIEVE